MDIVNNNWYIQIISRKYIGSLKSLLFKPRYSQDNMGTNQAGVQGRCRVLRGAEGASAIHRASRFMWLRPGSHVWAAGTVGRQMLQEQSQENKSVPRNTCCWTEIRPGRKDIWQQGSRLFNGQKELEMLCVTERWLWAHSARAGDQADLWPKAEKLLKVGAGAGPGFSRQWDCPLEGSTQGHYQVTRPGGTKYVYQEIRAPSPEAPPVPSRWSEWERLGKVTALRACEYFPGGTVDKNPPANAGDTGSIPSPVRPGMPQGNSGCAPQLFSPRVATTEVCAPRPCAPQLEVAPPWEARAPQWTAVPCSNRDQESQK